MASETVRIHPHTHETLKRLADEAGENMTDVLEKAIDAYARRKFLEDADRSYAALRGDAKAWADERAERQAWDATLGDGLEDD